MSGTIIDLSNYKKQKALEAYRNLPASIKDHILHDYRNFQNIIEQGIADIPDGISFLDMREAVKEAGFCNVENTGTLQHIYQLKDKNYFSPYDRRLYEEKIELLPGQILEKLPDKKARVVLDRNRLNLIVESEHLSTSQIDKVVRSCFDRLGISCPKVLLGPA